MSSELLNIINRWAEENYPYNFHCFEDGMHPCKYPSETGSDSYNLENTHAPFVAIGADCNNFGIIYRLDKSRHPTKITIFIIKGTLTISPHHTRYHDNAVFNAEDPEFFGKIKSFVCGASVQLNKTWLE